MKNRSRQAGFMVVEMALLMMTIMLPLTFGIAEYGRAIYQYNAIAKGTRDSVRYLSQYAPGDAARMAEAKCLAVFGKVNCDDNDTPLADGLTMRQVSVIDGSTDAAGHKLQQTDRGAVNLVTVQVSGYIFNSVISSFVPDIRFGPIGATMVQVL